MKSTPEKFGLCQNIQHLQKLWELKTPKQKFLFLYNIPKTMFESVGVRVYSDLRIYWLSQLGNIVIFYYISMTLYTLYYFGKRNQFLYGTRCLCGTGILISSLPLYWKAIGKDRFKFNSLLNFAGRYIYKNDRDSSKFSDVCEEGARKMWRSYGVLTCIICFSMSVVTFGPVYSFWRTGVWTTPLGTQFPYADESNVVFFVDLGIQIAVGIIGILSTVSIEMSQVIVNNVVEISADVISLYADEVSIYLRNSHGSSSKETFQLRNIKIQVQDFDRFIECFTDVFYWRTFAGPFALMFATAFSAFTQFHMAHPAGYGTAVASYIQLLILCYMGHNVSNANEKICGALNRIPWYFLPKNEQQDLARLLHRMQNGVKLTIGPLDELNYEKASDMSKRIYQFLMLLVQFVD